MMTHPLRPVPAIFLALVSAAGCGDWGSASTGATNSTPGSGTDVPVLSGNLTEVAGDPDVSATFALNGTTLYWVDSGGSTTDSIMSAVVPNGQVQQVYLAAPDGTATIEDLAVDDTNLYALLVSTDGGNYMSRLEVIPRSGGPYSVIATSEGPLYDLTVANGYVYFTGGTSLFGVPTTGGAYLNVDKNSDADPLFDPIEGLGSHAGIVYWTHRTEPTGNAAGNELNQPGTFENGVSGELMQLTSAIATPSAFASVPGGGNPLFAANDTQLFWMTTPNMPNDGSAVVSYVIFAPIGGGMPQSLTSVQGTVDGLAADDSNVYVLTAQGLNMPETLLEVTIADGTTTTLASGIQPPTAGDVRHALAVDAVNVYFANASGVQSVPK